MREVWRSRFRIHGSSLALPWPRVAACETVGPAYRSVGRVRRADEASVLQCGLSGLGQVTWQGRLYPVQPGQVLLTPVGDPEVTYGHGGRGEPWTFVFCSFHGLDANVRRLRDQHGPVWDLGPGNRVERMLLALRRSDGVHSLPASEAALLVMRLLAALVDGGPVPTPGADLCRRAEAAVAADPRLATVNALARRLDVSREHLARCFGEVRGIGPKAWLGDERLEIFRRRLVDSGDPLAGIAADLGFASLGRLCRRFAERYGDTPARYRRSRRSG